MRYANPHVKKKRVSTQKCGSIAGIESCPCYFLTISLTPKK